MNRGAATMKAVSTTLILTAIAIAAARADDATPQPATPSTAPSIEGGSVVHVGQDGDVQIRDRESLPAEFHARIREAREAAAKQAAEIAKLEAALDALAFFEAQKLDPQIDRMFHRERHFLEARIEQLQRQMVAQVRTARAEATEKARTEVQRLEVTGVILPWVPQGKAAQSPATRGSIEQIEQAIKAAGITLTDEVRQKVRQAFEAQAVTQGSPQVGARPQPVAPSPNPAVEMSRKLDRILERLEKLEQVVDELKSTP
jgi:hypothetical protein